MWLRHARSYHTWQLLWLQSFRHLFKRTGRAIGLLWITGSGTWGLRQLLWKGEKIKSTLCHSFLSLSKRLTASSAASVLQSLHSSPSPLLSHLYPHPHQHKQKIHASALVGLPMVPCCAHRRVPQTTSAASLGWGAVAVPGLYVSGAEPAVPIALQTPEGSWSLHNTEQRSH